MASGFNCWLCPATFYTKKDQRAHIDLTQMRLKVVCPWCVDGERWSNRIGDLKKHAITKHGADHLVSEKIFSAGVGFYLASYPEDYARVSIPAPPTASDARVAMELMRLRNPSRSTQDWERGWRLGEATPTREEPYHYVPGSPTAGSVAPPYSLSRPDMVTEIALNQLFVKEDRVELDIVQDNGHFIVNLNSSLKRDTSKIFAIQASVVNTQARPQGTVTEVKGTLFQEMCDKISCVTKVSETFIDSIQNITPQPGRLPLPFPTMPTQPTKAAVTPLQASSKPTSSSLPPPTSIPPPKTPAQQARDLLSWGIMPLVPPARRNWDADEAVEVIGRTASLKWPPRGWRTFTAERRLQVFEYAASMLDADASGFPVTSRADILDRYNFLALPGSKAPSLSSKAAMRLGNYRQLRDVALGRDSDIKIVQMLASAANHRDCELDIMIRAVNTAGIRLRLEK